MLHRIDVEKQYLAVVGFTVRYLIYFSFLLYVFGFGFFFGVCSLSTLVCGQELFLFFC